MEYPDIAELSAIKRFNKQHLRTTVHIMYNNKYITEADYNTFLLDETGEYIPKLIKQKEK